MPAADTAAPQLPKSVSYTHLDVYKRQSLACVRVAEVFGAQVFLVETGEINVVSKMHQLRQQGYDVPVGVEGANGGTVFELSLIHI